MDRLSGLDASFLYLESGAPLMHVCGLIVVDPATVPGGYDFDNFKKELSNRVSGVAMFNRKLKFVPERSTSPYGWSTRSWSIDPHVHRLAVPHRVASGTVRGRRAPRRHSAGSLPAALGDVGDRRAGRRPIVVFSKMHHASVDGVSGSNMLSYLCSLEPDAPPLDRLGPSASGSHRVPSDLELVGRGLVSTSPSRGRWPDWWRRRCGPSRRRSAGHGKEPRWPRR